MTTSKLGLTAMEVPASLNVIDSSVMEARGYPRISDAVETTPGVVVGQNPAAPSSFSMRGFTRSQITVLRDGIWLGPANMVMRPQNTFNLDRVEVLRGPSSVLNGRTTSSNPSTSSRRPPGKASMRARASSTTTWETPSTTRASSWVIGWGARRASRRPIPPLGAPARRS
ncbi:MAG: Plug domain-containing protein [Acidobacteria bacterium]|nr:Plug domain-containing protein [Acidobacteriota bacterium]